MMLARLRTGVVAAGILMLVSSTALAGRTQSVSYSIGAAGDIATAIGLTMCNGELRGGPRASIGESNMAVGCFDVSPDETKVTISVADDVFDHVGFSVEYKDQAGSHMSLIQHGCGSATMPIASGAAKLVVHIKGGAYSSIDCAEPSAAFSGTITAVFS